MGDGPGEPLQLDPHMEPFDQDAEEMAGVEGEVSERRVQGDSGAPVEKGNGSRRPAMPRAPHRVSR